MKILIIGEQERSEAYMPDLPIVEEAETVYAEMGTDEAELLARAQDADVIFADAIAKVPGSLIRQMPNLKLIHSEGVGYNGIDVEAASERGIYVCNNRGMNAGAVAEQTVLLMLGLLRDVAAGHASVRQGRQIQVKQQKMVEGITELADCTVGLIGFGNIAKATAVRLKPFGCRVVYYNRHRKPEEEEARYGVEYVSLDRLARISDIVSIHVAVTPETKGMIGREFLSRMKETAYFVNTSRGELVDNEAMKEALEKGRIAGAGFDTIAPEPTTADNPLVALKEDCPARVLYSPHIGGITKSSFRRFHLQMWQNAGRVWKGEKPVDIVNDH
ncbi:MAG TPA: 2-hydroxyacid dehydrogenase [Firmicutes bacterium]|nr:2-hydroxyacid dehydrogenase [Bacillota bacterium]